MSFPETMRTPFSHFKVEDGVAYFIFDNPNAKNADDQFICQDISDCTNYCTEHDEIRVLVFKGNNGCFSAGGDIKSMKDCIDHPETLEIPITAGVRQMGQAAWDVRACAKPTVAWMEGSAAGAGLSIALACDFRIADEGCKMNFGFSKIGYIPDMGATFACTRILGVALTTELFLTGRTFTAKDAAEWHLVTKAVPLEELEAAAMKMITKLAQGPTLAYNYIKTCINRATMSGYSLLVEDEAVYQNILRRSQDHIEGVRAFLEKRPPHYIGK